ncbi:MAG: hypothetical protein J1F37_07935 [Oscillospiraceae bacterium]|nr:hypothetical protein [Oscillospiraceae bacterium]
MFNFRNYILKAFIDAIGKMADYQIILNSAGWHEKGVLTEDDLSDIQKRIDAKNAASVEGVTDDVQGDDEE